MPLGGEWVEYGLANLLIGGSTSLYAIDLD
jgi:hypothetical protein